MRQLHLWDRIPSELNSDDPTSLHILQRHPEWLQFGIIALHGDYDRAGTIKSIHVRYTKFEPNFLFDADLVIKTGDKYGSRYNETINTSLMGLRMRAGYRKIKIRSKVDEVILVADHPKTYKVLKPFLTYCKSGWGPR